MTASDIWIGIDLGTQSVKVLAVDGEGKVLASGQAPLRSERRDERHEQNPAEWWEALGRAGREAMRSNEQRHRIRAVSVCGTSGTVLLVDNDARPMSMALMYDDGRAVDEARECNRHGHALWKKLGYGSIQTVWGLPKWMWLASKHSEGRNACFAQQADFITGKLAGHRTAADVSNSLKSGCDTIDGTWNDNLMAALALPLSRLPTLVRPGETVGTICADAAAHTGLPQGIPIVAGMTDGCASQLASGSVQTGSWNSVLGTTLVLKGKTAALIRDPGGIIYSHRAPDGGWLPGGASSAGAGAFVHALGPEADLDGLASAAEPRLTQPEIIYPLASGRGERFPFIALDMSFTIPNSVADDRVEIYRALGFGLAAVERLCFDYLAASGFPMHGDVSLTGGGSRNGMLNRLRATMLRRPLKVPAIAEPALGMALLASTIETPMAQAAARMVQIARTIEPDAAHTNRVSDYYLAFIGHLQSKGWLGGGIADYARKRAVA